MGVLKSGHPRNLTGLGWIACWTMSFKIQEIDTDVNLVSNSLHLARPFQYGVSDVWHQLTANALGKQDSLFHVAVKNLTDQFLFNKYQPFLAFFPLKLLCCGGSRPAHHTGFGQQSVCGGAVGAGAVQNHCCPADALCEGLLPKYKLTVKRWCIKCCSALTVTAA